MQRPLAMLNDDGHRAKERPTRQGMRAGNEGTREGRVTVADEDVQAGGPTAWSVALVTIDVDKRVSGPGVVYPSYCGTRLFCKPESAYRDSGDYNGDGTARKLRIISLGTARR